MSGIDVAAIDGARRSRRPGLPHRRRTGGGGIPYPPGQPDRGHRARFPAVRRADARDAPAGSLRRRPGLDVQGPASPAATSPTTCPRPSKRPTRRGVGRSMCRLPAAARSWSRARIRRTIARLSHEIASLEANAPRCPVGVIETSAALGACLLVLAVAVALDRRPYRPGKRNYVPIMIVAVAGILVLGRHLLSLMGDN